MKTYFFIIIFIIMNSSSLFAQNFTCDDAPAGTIFCDDFEDEREMSGKYFEYGDDDGDHVVMDGIGRDGSRGIRVIWQEGEVSAGGFKKSFGRTPGSYIGQNAEYPDSSFDEIYWRMDVKHQEGWQGGGPAKLSRALTLANSNWATGMMAHIWSGGNNGLYLGMDPASGISKDGQLMTTKYNDFENLRWLGFKAGTTEIFSTESSGKWYCVECRVKLNTPGKSDGVLEFWIDGVFQAGSYDLNWHGTWNNDPDNMMINAIFFENYWNDGSPVQQERYFDNIVISTRRIGCGTPDAVERDDDTMEEIEIYPNPAGDYIVVENTLNHRVNPVVAHNSEIRIYNFLGEEVKAVETGLRPVSTIDISGFAAGVYYVRIGFITKKFVIAQ